HWCVHPTSRTLFIAPPTPSYPLSPYTTLFRSKYGRERAGLAATVITYRARSAGREVARALGLSGDVMTALSGSVWGRSSARLGRSEEHTSELQSRENLVCPLLL